MDFTPKDPTQEPENVSFETTANEGAPSSKVHATASSTSDPVTVTPEVIPAEGETPEVPKAQKIKGAAQMAAGGALAAAGVPMLILPGPGAVALVGGAALASKGQRNFSGRKATVVEEKLDAAAHKLGEATKNQAKQTAQRAKEQAPEVAKKIAQEAPATAAKAVKGASHVATAAAKAAPQVASKAAEVAPQVAEKVAQKAPEVMGKVAQGAAVGASVVAKNAPVVAEKIAKNAPAVGKGILNGVAKGVRAAKDAGLRASGKRQ